MRKRIIGRRQFQIEVHRSICIRRMTRFLIGHRGAIVDRSIVALGLQSHSISKYKACEC